MVADANARTFLSMLLFYAVSNVCFRRKLAKPLFGTNNVYLVQTILLLLQELRFANETYGTLVLCYTGATSQSYS